MAGEINFGILDTSLPGKVGNSYIAGLQQAQEAQANKLRMAMAGQEQQMNALKLKQGQQEYDDSNALRNIYSQSGGDLNKAYEGLIGSGQIKPAMELKAKIDAQKKLQIEESLNHFKTADEIMAGVNDQQSYDAAKQRMVSIFGPEALQNIPQQYDPKAIEQAKYRALGIKGQLEDQWKALDFNQKEKEFGYRQKHDAASLALEARGQNLTNARGIEANKLKAQENGINANSIVGKNIRDVELKLQDDYRTESKGFSETSTAMKKILGSIETADKNPGSALASGTAFMKLLDPNSVVRESELGMALNASGWFDRAANVANTLQNGKIMTSTQKANLKKASQDLFEEAKSAQREVDAAYEQRARDYGADPSRIIVDRGQKSTLGAGKFSGFSIVK